MDPGFWTALGPAGAIAKVAFMATCIAAMLTAVSKIICVYLKRYEDVKVNIEFDGGKANFEGLSPEEIKIFIKNHCREQFNRGNDDDLPPSFFLL